MSERTQPSNIDQHDTQGLAHMLNGTARNQIGSHLRTVYDGIPKGGIPDRLWKLLLAIERKFDLRK